jgi:hypothetical protein
MRSCRSQGLAERPPTTGMPQTANREVGCIIDGGHEGKMEILAKIEIRIW